MIKRFEYLEDLRCIVEDEDGPYVAYEDYKKLEDKLKLAVEVARAQGLNSLAKYLEETN